MYCAGPAPTIINEIRLVNNTGKDLIIYSQDGKSIMNLAPKEEKKFEGPYSSLSMGGNRITILTVSLKEVPFIAYKYDPNTGQKLLRRDRPDILDIAIAFRETGLAQWPTAATPRPIYRITLSLDQNGNIVCDRCIQKHWLR